jgi:hypothetical protein
VGNIGKEERVKMERREEFPTLTDTKRTHCIFTQSLTHQQIQKIFSRLQDACELLFQDIKPLLDVFEILATRENDLS